MRGGSTPTVRCRCAPRLGRSTSLGIIKQATLGRYDQGLGVSYGKGDSHTIDNKGRLDFVLLQFDRPVSLAQSEFRTGWHYMNDTDATIGVGDLAQAFNSQPAFNGQSFLTALSGFDIYRSGSFGVSGNSTRGINPDGLSGNSWVIGAGSSLTPDLFADGFKLKRVSYDIGQTPAIPEPSTWAMMLLGFGAVGTVVRRKGRARVTVSYA